MKEFVKDYTLSNLTITTGSLGVEKLLSKTATSTNLSKDYVECGKYIVFYENLSDGTGMNFYIYDLGMNLIKTETLTDNWITAVGKLKQDEDGNFYLIGDMNPSESSGETVYYSLILLNNIITQSPKIRKWYKLDSMGIGRDLVDCQKRIGSANYLMIYSETRIETDTTLRLLHFVEFIINVQSGNSYVKYVHNKYYSIGGDSNPDHFGIAGIGYLYNQENSKILLVRARTWHIIVETIDFEIYTENTINEGERSVGGATRHIYDNYKSLMAKPSILINGINSIVFIQVYNGNYELIQYNSLTGFGTRISTPLIHWSNDDYILTHNHICHIRRNNDGYSMYLYKYEIGPDSIDIYNNARLYIWAAYNGTLPYRVILLDTNIFNLNYIIFIPDESFIPSVSHDYWTIYTTATDNRTGEYTSYNSLVPDHINVHGTTWNDNLFSRKITNRSVVGNQLSAETNIPYSMLNSGTINVEQLIGKTNKIINSENTVISKNEYESLYLNFIKHINVIDNNFNRNELQNEISSLLAESLFTDKAETNYQVAPIWWIKLFKTNGETEIQAIPYSSIIQISDYVYKFNIIVDGSTVNQIQLLAKDQKTPYITIPLYSINGVARIQQTMRFE